MHTLDEETLKALLLKSIRDECIYILNFMGKGDIYQLSFGDICELCIHISRGKARTGKNPRDPFVSRIKKSIRRVVRWIFLRISKKIFWGVLVSK